MMKKLFVAALAATLALSASFGFASHAHAQDSDAPPITEVAASDENFSTLVAAIGLTDLGDVLGDCDAGPFTVLAPTNDGFAKALGDLGLAPTDLISQPDLVADLLRYHVFDGAFTSDVVVTLDGVAAPSLQGEEVTVSVDGDTVNLLSANPSPATVTAVDIQACNGVIHAIDNMMFSPSQAAALGVEGGGDSAAQDSSEEEAADEEQADLPETGVESAQLAVIGGSIAAAGALLVGFARQSRRETD